MASRDRIARFGFELIEWLCSECRTQLIVLDTADGAPDDYSLDMEWSSIGLNSYSDQV